MHGVAIVATSISAESTQTHPTQRLLRRSKRRVHDRLQAAVAVAALCINPREDRISAVFPTLTPPGRHVHD